MSKIDLDFLREVVAHLARSHDGIHVAWEILKAYLPVETPPYFLVSSHNLKECDVDDELRSSSFYSGTVVLPHFCDVSSEGAVIFHYTNPDLAQMTVACDFVLGRLNFTMLEGSVPLDLVAFPCGYLPFGYICTVSKAAAFVVGSTVNQEPLHELSDVDVLVCSGLPLYLAIPVVYDMIDFFPQVPSRKLHIFRDTTGLGPHGRNYPLFGLSLALHEGVFTCLR